MQFESTIIAIPNERTVLIKGGYDQGVNIGDEFRIVIKGPIVTDPTTKKVLGTYDKVKVTLEVTQVYDKFSELKHIKRSKSNTLASALLTTSTTTVQTLNVKAEDISENLLPPMTPIEIGDIVQKI